MFRSQRHYGNLIQQTEFLQAGKNAIPAKQISSVAIDISGADVFHVYFLNETAAPVILPRTPPHSNSLINFV